MKLSVIIPVYGVEKYLEQCVESILNTQYTDMEIILVDDGSPDKCPAICDDFAERDARVKVIHKDNGGLSSARNAGIKEAKAGYLIFVDSDDWWNENVDFEKVMEYVDHFKNVDMFLFSSLDYIEGKGFFKRKEHYNLNKINTSSIADYCESLLKNGNFEVAAYTKILKTNFVKNNELYFYEGMVCEDSEWMLRVLRAIKNVKIIEVDLYVYRSGRPGSIVNTIKLKNIQDMLFIIKETSDFYRTREDPVKEYELDYCSYLWFCALANSPKCTKLERRFLKNELKSTAPICKYANSSKTKMAYRVYKVLGYTLTCWILSRYLALKNRKNLNKIQVIK